ncbi:MAG: hypothetical protein ABI557_20785, partial [Aureliella sp.]
MTTKEQRRLNFHRLVAVSEAVIQHFVCVREVIASLKTFNNPEGLADDCADLRRQLSCLVDMSR